MSDKAEDISLGGDTKTIALLERICRETTRQNEQMKRQIRLTRLVALFCACLAAVSVFACASLLPRVTDILSQATGILTELESTVRTVNETVPSAMDDINALISQSRTGLDSAFVSIEAALGKINAIDIDSLNKAIADLAGIVRPLAALLGR